MMAFILNFRAEGQRLTPMQADGTKPEEVTAANLDKSGLLESLIQQKYSAHTEDILGELQVGGPAKPASSLLL